MESSAGLNVSVLIGTLSASYGGPSYSVRRLWQSVLDQGIGVTIHSADAFKVRESADDRASWEPLDCRQWPAGTIRALGYSASMASGIAGCLREGSSVISQHGLWLHQGRLARKIGNERRVPVIIHPHGMLEPWALRRSPWKKRLVGRLWEYENLKEAACLRVTARAELESVRGFGLKNAVALIPNGIDVDDFAKLPDVAEAGERFPALAGRRVLLFLSRVHPKKGLPLLLEVWKKLGALRADWVLAIAGPDEGGHTAKLQGLVLEWGLEDSVKFLGPLFGEDKLAAYSLAQLFVLPSYSENFGVAVAEALAGAVPVITTCGTPWEGLKEHGCGWWVEANGAALGEAVREALSLPERELALMGEKGRRWMSLDFNWERIAAQMVRVCEWTLGGGQPPGCVITN